jgi:polysaccharide biosynthesis protein PelC
MPVIMLKFWPIMMMTVVLSGCVSRKIQQGGTPGAVNSAAGIYVAPFHNATPSPSAGRALTEIATTTLLAHGLPVIQSEAANARAYGLIEESGHGDMLAIAASLRASHALLGTVHEYRFKSDLDGAPTVGVTLRLVEVGSGMTVWQGTGSQSGSYYGSLSQTAQGTVDKLAVEMTGKPTRRFSRNRTTNRSLKTGHRTTVNTPIPTAQPYAQPIQSQTSQPIAGTGYQGSNYPPAPTYNNSTAESYHYQQTGYRAGQAKPGLVSRMFGRDPNITREESYSYSNSYSNNPKVTKSRRTTAKKPWVEYEQIRRRSDPSTQPAAAYPPTGTYPPAAAYPQPGTYPPAGRYPAPPINQQLAPPPSRNHYDPIYTPPTVTTTYTPPAAPSGAQPPPTANVAPPQQPGWTPSSY